MAAKNLEALVCSALDPVLVPAGFAPGQGGGVQVIFCAAHDEFSDRYPTMPQANTYPHGSTACIDLIINGLVDGGFESAEIEGDSLQHTLRSLGSDRDAERIVKAQNAPMGEALPVLAAVLARLFDTRQR